MSTIDRKVMPYAPPSNVTGVIRRYRDRSIPDKIDVALLTDIGVPKGNIHRTLAALRFLGLLDDDDQPTSAFTSLQMATDEEYPAVLEALLKNAYQEVFRAGIDPTKDGQSVLLNHFRRYQPASQRSRQVILFLALCREAGLSTVDAPRERTSRSLPAPRPSTTNRSVVEAKVDSISRAQMPKSVEQESHDPRTRYLATLIEAVGQISAQGNVPPKDLLDRIERLMGIGLEPEDAFAVGKSEGEASKD
jgi:hypothetical protein